MRSIKNILIFFVILINGILSVSYAKNISSFNEALLLAKKENKNIIVYFYRENCPYCRQMDTYVLSEKDVELMINTNFVYFTIDLESKEGIPLAERFKVSVSPTFLIVSPENKAVYEIVGSMEKEKFLKELAKVQKVRN